MKISSVVLSAGLLLLVLGSCSSGYGTAPRNLDNACSIVNERPSYLRAFKATERKWGVPVATQMAMIYQESKFISNNRPPHRYILGIIPAGRASSALGYSQALDGTWAEYVDEEGGFGSSREDIYDASDFMGWYMSKTREETGVALHDTRNQYLAYHDGRAGYLRGTWRKKGWLIRVSNEVAKRAVTYHNQLKSCGKI